MDSRPANDHRVLIALLALAAVLRLPLALWPNIIHPDEIYQYLDPAWRVLGNDGVVSWEWRYGMRGWLAPSVLAGPLALGDWVSPGGVGAFAAARVTAALSSLSIVASAWFIGARISRLHAVVAAFVAAVWFEFVLFAPHTLGEPLSTALILPAALLVTQPSDRTRNLVIGGALLMLGGILRFQYAPAIAVLTLGACWGAWRKIPALVMGGLLALIPAALADAANGAIPLAWIAANIQHNWIDDRAAGFGVLPALTYFASFGLMWSLAAVAIVPAIVVGARHAPLLLATALANIAFHTLIGHKEYRFIYLSVVLLIVLAALGSADGIQRLRARTGLQRWAPALGLGGWLAVSAALATTGVMPGLWMNGVAAAKLAAQVRDDPQLCGLALYAVPIPFLPERARLSGRSPIYAVDPLDPEVAGAPAAALAQASPSFNRMIAPKSLAQNVPAGFSQSSCGEAGGIPTCLYARAGACTPEPGARLAVNAVLTRVDR